MDTFTIAGTPIGLGEQKTIYLELARLYDYTSLTMPVRVIRGQEPGPVFFVSAAIHGDEIVGTEIIKRLLKHRALRRIRGTLLAVPIVNVFGYNNLSRYLPDRRDLNRSFPGSAHGSLAARIAHVFLQEIAAKANYGIDLHSAPVHRANLPQIRAYLNDPTIAKLAETFGVPVVLNSKQRDGSLRQAAVEAKVKMLLFEGGEGLRCDEKIIKCGLRGILAVMREVGMLADGSFMSERETRPEATFTANSSYWVRAPQSGGLRALKSLGAKVGEGSKLAEVSDQFGENKVIVRAKTAGIIIGENKLPLVNRGDALFHIATFDDTSVVSEQVSEFEDLLEGWLPELSIT